MPRTWQKVEEMFDGSYRYETSKLKLILDGLMNAGMPQYLSVLEYSYSRNIALVVSITVKVLNFRTLKMFVVINLKLQQRGFSIEKFIQIVQIELQTVQTLIRLLH